MQDVGHKAVLQKWLDSVSEPTTNRSDIKANVNRLYKQLELDEPQIIECRGPLQQVFYPGLIGLMFKSGKEYSAKSRFVRNPIDKPEVRQEWDNLWNEAASAIDWAKPSQFSDGIGELLIGRIHRLLERGLRTRLVTHIDNAIGMEEGEKLEKLFERELLLPHQGLRRALLPRDAELNNIWRNFCNRLSDDVLYQVRTDQVARNGSVASDGPDQNAWSGAWNWTWIASGDCARQSGFKLSEKVKDDLDMWIKLLTKATAYLFCENCCFVYLKPREVSFDDRWRLHNQSDAAVEFFDGTQYFMWHGVEIDGKFITNPKALKVKIIEQESNIEVRRALIEAYGLEQFVRDSAAKKIQEDEYGALYMKLCSGDESIVVVKVYNSTPEPDGTFKEYFIRVPPEIRTAHEAVAWSFGMDAREYGPLKET